MKITLDGDPFYCTCDWTMAKLWKLLSLAALVVLLLAAAEFAATASGSILNDDRRFKTVYDTAVNAINAGDYAASILSLQKALQIRPSSIEATQLIGVLSFKVGRTEEAITYLGRAFEGDNLRDLGIAANYIEVLRSAGQLQRASDIGHSVLAKIAPERLKEFAGIQYNLGIVDMALGKKDMAIDLFLQAVNADPTLVRAWQLCSEIVLQRSPAEAERILMRAVTHHPDNSVVHFMLGTAYQFQHKLGLALESYLRAEQLNDENYAIKGNIAATYQSLGHVEQAIRYYERALPHCPEDAGLYNNYGALLGIMGKEQEQVVWLEKALAINPKLRPALVNLAGFYQDEGELQRARELTRRAAAPDAISHSGDVAEQSSGPLLRLREALMLSPVTHSWWQMWEERRNITDGLLHIAHILDTEAARGIPQGKYAVDTSLDRIHFYVSYHGLNDRYLQDLIMSLYHRHLDIEYFSPYVLAGPELKFPGWVVPSDSANIGALNTLSDNLNVKMKTPFRKARVGFMSKFFGVFEPHGMLLDGVMRYLPRQYFEVIALPVARADGKPLSPSIQQSADAVYNVSLTYVHAQEMIQELRLDVLVFADTVSEPMAHFLSHSRLAPIQMVFWGNPITSGSHQIDYFISADVMEHPYRTRMPVSDEPYSEQVVLMEGQGIWYLRPDIEGDLVSTKMKDLVAAPRVFSRADFHLQQEWFLYVLPQSVFKIHPLYDFTLRDILARVPQGHLVVTGGRRPRWTEIYVNRLRAALGPELSQRLHVIERVSSEQFTALLDIADVILHPFPFDGSKTSADALHAHKPIVTLPTEYLRGRMGAAFLRTINLPELVARSRTEYVDISVRLAFDPAFLRDMVGKITERVDLIWEDMEVPFTWSNMLCTVIGVAAPSWDEFLSLTGRDVTVEKARSAQREHYARLYDLHWGPEKWLLNDGIASLETMFDSPEQVPCIFNDWNCGSHERTPEQRNGTLLPNRASTPAMPATAVPVVAADDDDVFSFPEATHITQVATAAPRTTGPVGNLVVAKTTTAPTVPAPTTAAAAEKADAGLAQRVANIRSQYLDLANDGHFEAALPLAASIYSNYGHISLFLVELGLIHVFVGNYSGGMQYCKQAAAKDEHSSLIQGCIGLAGMYVKEEADLTLASFKRALALKATERATIARIEATKGPIPPEEMLAVEAAAGIVSSPVFMLPEYALQNNLLMSFRIHHRHQQCMEWCVEVNHLPPVTAGAAYIMAFSLVNWSDAVKPDIDFLESALRGVGNFQAPPEVTLWSEIKRVQTTAMHMITVALECLQGMSNDGTREPFLGGMLQDLMVIMLRRENITITEHLQVLQRIQLETHKPSTTPITMAPAALPAPLKDLRDDEIEGVALILQYYSPAESAKNADINIALWRNLQNKHVADIYLLNEVHINFAGFPNNHKIHQYVIGDRLTFKKAFEFANEHLVGRTVVIANADIFFDDTLQRVSGAGLRRPQLKKDRKVLALLKWIHNQQTASMSMNVRTDSQDAWIFQPPIEQALINELDFYLGLPKCDNRIVYVFQDHNYTVLGPAFAVHALELDSIQRTQVLYSTKHTVVGSTNTLLLSDEFVF